MAVVHSLGLDSSIVSLGNILGTGGSQELYDNINARTGGGSFFGGLEDPFRQGYQSFISNVVEPIRRARVAYQDVAKRLNSDHSFIPIDSIEVLERGIPSCMHVAVLCHPRIQQQHIEERIDGFGYDPVTIPDASNNEYARALANGYIADVAEHLRENKSVTITHEWCTADEIDLCEEDLEALRSTYMFIDEFVDSEETTHLDFTSYPDLHC